MTDDKFMYALTRARWRADDVANHLERASRRRAIDREAVLVELMRAKEALARSREFIDAAIEALT